MTTFAFSGGAPWEGGEPIRPRVEAHGQPIAGHGQAIAEDLTVVSDREAHAWVDRPEPVLHRRDEGGVHD